MHGAWQGAGLGAGVSGDGFMLSQVASAVHSSWSCLSAHWVSPGDWVGGWEDLQGRGPPLPVFILFVSEAEPTHPTPVSQLTWDAVSISASSSGLAFCLSPFPSVSPGAGGCKGEGSRRRGLVFLS